MPFPLDQFALLRPYLYHLTAATNIARIRRTMRLESATRILEAAGETTLVRSRRRESRIVTVYGESVHVRDQAPLHQGNMALDNGWTFEDFVAHLNGRVFFWPGSTAGPISYGVRHFARYEMDAPAILRIPTAVLFASNPDAIPLFCRYNSGSPRCSYGNKSPRTARTFEPASEAPYRASEVVEVTFEDAITLPPECQHGAGLTGPWRRLRGLY
jgi:hypothetical protein